jgi:hypothetical protein
LKDDGGGEARRRGIFGGGRLETRLFFLAVHGWKGWRGRVPFIEGGDGRRPEGCLFGRCLLPAIISN